MTINATMKNDQADQLLTGQRAKFSSRFDGKGAARDLNDLFPDGPLSDAETSFNQTKGRFLKKLYADGIKINEDFHPDFPEGYESSDYAYGGSIALLENATSKSDKPSRKGPNLNIPSIDDNGQPFTESSHANVTPEGGDHGNSRGFGINFDSVNEENSVNPYTVSYIERKDSDDPQAVPRLGEYINISNYLTDPSE